MLPRYLKICAFLTGAILLLSSCGNAKSSMDMDNMMYTETYAAGAYDINDSWEEEASGDTTMALSAPMQTNTNRSNQSTAVNDLENRKLIKSANLTIETQTFMECTDALTEQISMFGGYIENSSVYGNAEYEKRSANYTIRIPATQYNNFLEGIVTLGSVTSRTESVEDVTMSYTDVESRIRSLETEYNTLLGILEKCDNVSDVIEVQNRITDVTYELDSYKSRLRTCDNLISYCTVYVNVCEVYVYTEPTENISLWQRITRDIRNNYADLGDGFIEFFIWFVSAMPFILVIAVIVVCIVRAVRRSERRKREAAMANYTPYIPQNTPTETEKTKEPAGKH